MAHRDFGQDEAENDIIYEEHIEEVKLRSAAYMASGLCGATDGGYGACQMRGSHRRHFESLEGAPWAEWSGDDRHLTHGRHRD